MTPSSANEIVNIIGCIASNCGFDGILMTNGNFHSITASVAQDNGQWGICLLNTNVEAVNITNTVVQGNDGGGVLLCGLDHVVNQCDVVSNGSSGSATAGVVFGSTSGGAATNCRVSNCTLAFNNAYGAQRVLGTGNRMLDNETYFNVSGGYDVNVAAPSPTAKYFVVDTVNNQIVIGGSVQNGPANGSVTVQFFSTLNLTNQGVDYLDDADINVPMNASGNGSFFHAIDVAQEWLAVANNPPGPFTYQLDDEDRLVFTATSTISTGTSEFSNLAEPTLPGDFNLNGAVTGGDFLIWQQNQGSTNADYWDGDADFDGDVDGDDFHIWEQNYGN